KNREVQLSSGSSDDCRWGLEADARNSRSQCAAHLGLSKSHYARIAYGLTAYSAEIALGEETGDWSALEDVLFGRFGEYRVLGFYQRALDLALGKSDASGPCQPAVQEPKPAPVQVQLPPPVQGVQSPPTHQQVSEWLELGMLAERYLTREGKALVLKLPRG
ncbi:MAG: hypothetical protein PSV13_15765, partial [Lacunisphaera sp.]|nr:hypothetical protein [Lacunisphaera sp.]